MSSAVSARHRFLLLEHTEELRMAAMTLLREGLECGEQCVYILPQGEEEKVLQTADASAAWERGALRFMPSWLPENVNSIVRAREIWRDVEAGLAAFPAVRYIVGVQGGTGPGVTSGQLCHWEATLNPLVEGLAVRIYCLYDLSAMSPDRLNAGLRTHPEVVHRGQTVQNPHYEADRILEEEPHLNDSRMDEGRLREMLKRLESAA